MTKTGFWSLLLILITAAALQGQSRESVLKSVQDTSKWTPVDQPVAYDEKNLGSLAGKRASTLMRYGFIGATVQKWSGAKGPVRLTLYEMFDPSAAYGLFSLDRNIQQSGFTTIPLGTEGFRQGGNS